MATEQSAEERNVELVKDVFDAVARGDQAAAMAAYDQKFVIELNWGHPASGAFQGGEIQEGRTRMIKLLGLTDIQLREVIADGPHRVVVLADGKGTDAAGEPWSIPAVQLITLENGKIIRTSHMFTGHDRLLEIARGREEEEFAPLNWPGVGVRDLT
jgi:ketosteroid isomerase-like protein